MTYYSNDPNRGGRRRYDSIDRSTTWIAAALAIAAVLGIILYTVSNTGNLTASNPTAATVGSGTTSSSRQGAVQPGNLAPARPAIPLLNQ